MLDYLPFFMFPVALFGFNYGWGQRERALLRAGRSGLEHYVEVDGVLVPAVLPWWHRPASLGATIRRQLRVEVASPTGYIMLGLGAFGLSVGLSFGDVVSLVTGAGIIGLLGWWFYRAVRCRIEATKIGLFEVTLVEVEGHVIFGLGRATVRTDDGATFKTAVHWRPTKALSEAGSVRLVFAGEPSEPNRRVLVGFPAPMRQENLLGA